MEGADAGGDDEADFGGKDRAVTVEIDAARGAQQVDGIVGASETGELGVQVPFRDRPGSARDTRGFSVGVTVGAGAAWPAPRPARRPVAWEAGPMPEPGTAANKTAADFISILHCPRAADRSYWRIS